MRLMTFFGNTDMGKIRTNNEDAFIAQNIWNENHILAVAIDGVGGYDGGEVASGLAQKLIVEYLENYSNGERLELLKQAVIYANNTIFAERKNLPHYSSMSCVLTAVLIEVEEMRINMAHVGDTRLYQFANNQLVKLSHDHSLVGYREEIGELTEEEAMRHPQRNVIGRDVGSTFLENGNTDYVETATFPLLPHSTLLLCSDGLCDMVTSNQMIDILQQTISIEEKVNALITAANNAGGKDNITVILIETEFEEEPQTIIEEVVEPIDFKDVEEKEINMPQQTIEKSNNKHKVCTWIWVIVFVFVMISSFLLGSLWGYKIIPHEFLETIHKDSVKYDIMYRDSVIIKLQNDTAELHQKINIKDEEIKTLQNQLFN